MYSNEQHGNKSTSGNDSTTSSSKDEACNKQSINNISSSPFSSTTTAAPITHTIHEVNNKNTLKLDYATISEMTDMITDKRITSIKKLFKDELRQIDIIIAIISKGKALGFFLGMTLKDIVKGLVHFDKFFLYKTNVYVLNLLKQISHPNVSLLEVSNDDTLFNVTSFSLAYYNHDEKQEFSRFLV